MAYNLEAKLRGTLGDSVQFAIVLFDLKDLLILKSPQENHKFV